MHVIDATFRSCAGWSVEKIDETDETRRGGGGKSVSISFIRQVKSVYTRGMIHAAHLSREPFKIFRPQVDPMLPLPSLC